MRGIFYTTATVIFVAPIVLIITVYLASVQTSAGGLTTKALGDRLAGYASSVDNDIPRAMNIITRRSIQAAIVDMESTGQPMINAEERIVELMMNGTIYGNITNLSSQDFTLRSWSSELAAKGLVYGFRTNVTVISVVVRPYDTYRLGVNLRLFVNASDRAGTMKLERIYNTTVPVSIEGIIDPLYMLKTNGVFKVPVTAPNITVYGVAALDRAIAEKFYTPSTNGPSFLDRLEGRLSISPKYAGMTNIGLETIVNLPELQANGFAIKPDQSDVDYIYFDALEQTGSVVSGSSYAWLRLDAAHKSKYGV